ncbi:MAG: type II toxin-antitoxin system VapC family toxin [Gemmatimonadales bacterium]|nr:type II toxin-antitoxin system VapC family toxin [Gemmatimonadales bacterium]MYG18025.1 type II toxin-antitoxin system VapC family toxin [Gemmatimonadales bacterium]MYH08940.1 type II toxin-antitoxin system VapC family toxin [Gemmatimonadales bacterium]MYL05556.1 type II toxin-antitoxin system VapC family toxin [Gemmatimonadales bacterium]
MGTVAARGKTPLRSSGADAGSCHGLLIDTSVLIAVERGELNHNRILGVAQDAGAPLAMAAITVSEFLQGVHAARGARRVSAERSFNMWLDAVPALPFDLEAARVHALLAWQLARRGTPIGAHDLMIAATAVSRDYRVATRDRRSFHRVEGLGVEYW